MKKSGLKILTIACAVGANLTFSSCVDNLLNQTPGGELASSLYWKTESRDFSGNRRPEYRLS